jgi:hypothetical protein
MACKYYINNKVFNEQEITEYINSNYIKKSDIKYTTIEDIANILAYSNSKLILEGYEVEYTTPDDKKFKTYAEASNHISELSKNIQDVNLDNINFETELDTYSYYYMDRWFDSLEEAERYKKELNVDTLDVIEKKKTHNGIKEFLVKNKEYEQSKEIIDEWKKINNIVYNPEEIYSRGQEFVSVVGAYSLFDVNLMMQNLLQHIEDNEKADGKFAISAFTKPIGKNIGHLEGGGGKIKFKIYPKSEDILWATNRDAYSGSVWDASEKINKDKKSELLGVTYIKYPSLNNISAVQPNLASIVDDLAHHHNEVGIILKGNNFRLEYDEDIPYQTKKIIDGINKILDQKYGKLVKPEINSTNNKQTVKYDVKLESPDPSEYLYKTFDTIEEAQSYADYMTDKIGIVPGFLKPEKRIVQQGIQPTQTKDNLKESIESVKHRMGIISSEYGYIDVNDEILASVEGILDSLKNAKIIFNDDKVNEVYIKSLKWFIKEEGKYPHGEFDTKKEAEEYLQNEIAKAEVQLDELKLKPKKKYTEQALINTKIAALKEVAKKYPRSLIRSEVVPISKFGNNVQYEMFDVDELPFQKIPSTSETNNNNLQEGLKNLNNLSTLSLSDKNLAIKNHLQNTFPELFNNVEIVETIENTEGYLSQQSNSLLNTSIKDPFIYNYLLNNSLPIKINKETTLEDLLKAGSNIINFDTTKFLIDDKKGLTDAQKHALINEALNNNDPQAQAAGRYAKNNFNNNEVFKPIVQKLNNQRLERLNEWKKYITEDNTEYAKNPFIQKFIWDMITKGASLSNSDIKSLSPQLNQGVLAEIIYNAFEKSKDTILKLPSSKEVLSYYSDKIAELALASQQKLEVKGKENTIGKWIYIPSATEDSENFEANVKKLQALSYDGKTGGKDWCTRTFNAKPYLEKGGFYLYIEKDENEEFKSFHTKIAIRLNSNDTIAEIQGHYNDGTIPLEYLEQINQLRDSDVKLHPKQKIIQNKISNWNDKVDKAKKDYETAIKDFVDIKETIVKDENLLEVVNTNYDTNIENIITDKQKAKFYSWYLKQEFSKEIEKIRTHKKRIKLFKDKDLDKETTQQFFDEFGFSYELDNNGDFFKVATFYTKENRINTINYLPKSFSNISYLYEFLDVLNFSKSLLYGYIHGEEYILKSVDEFNKVLNVNILNLLNITDIMSLKNLNYYEITKIENEINDIIKNHSLFKNIKILGYSNFLDLIPYISEKEAQESFNLVSFIQELKKNDLIISNSINKNTNFKINYYNNKSGLIFKNFNQSISNKNIFPRPNVIVHNGKEYFLSYDNGLNTENLPYFKKSDIVPNFFAINRDNGKYYKFENGVYSYEAAGEITIISKEEYEKEYFDNDDSMEQFKTLYEETLIPKYEEKSTIKSFMKKLFNWSITNNKIEGSYNPITDRVQISSENIDSLERAEQVFLHEIVGHRGVENLLSNENLDRYNQIILGFSKELDKNANELIFKSGYKSINDFASDYGFKIGSVEYYKELIARVAENKEIYNKNRSWFNQLIFEIKFLLSNIFNIDFNNQDIVQFLIKAKKSVSNNNSIVNNSKSKLKDGKPSYSKKSTDINNNYQTMRNQAVGFIGELNPNKEDRFDSSTYGSFKHFNNNPIEEKRYLENVPEDTSNGNKIMLDSDNENELLEQTKSKILELHNKGFEFLVENDKFIDYLKSIGANFTVFGTDNNSRILYQRVELTEQQRKNIQELKQLKPAYAVASDEKVQEFIDTIYPEIETQFNKEQITILNSPETINKFNEFIGNTNQLINEESLEKTKLPINVEKLFEDEKFANEIYESLGYKNDTTLPDDNKVHKILSDINKQHHLGNIKDLDGDTIYDFEKTIFQNGLVNLTSNQWGHGAANTPYGEKGIERLENILSKRDRFTGDFGPIRGSTLSETNKYPNAWETGRFMITRNDNNFYSKDGSLNINGIEIILNRSFEPYGSYLASKYPNIIFKDAFGNIIKISNQLTPKQKQEAIHLYSQYLKQNPNSSVEQFKSWVEEFNKNNQKLNSNIQIFSDNKQGAFDSSSLKDDDLALMLFNKASGANVKSIDEITFDHVQHDTSKKDFAFFGGFSRDRNPSLSEVLNQTGVYPEHIMFIGESKVYPNFYEILEKQNEVIENSVKENFDKIFSFGFTSSVFDQIKKELNNSKSETFVFETADGKIFKFPKRFVKGFYKLTSKISQISEENRQNVIDAKVKQIIREKRESNETGIKPVIVKEFYNDGSTDILKYAIELIDNPIIKNAVKNAKNIKVVVFSNEEFSKDGVAAWYQPNTNSIYIYEENLRIDRGAFQLLAHELIHGVTHISINYDNEFKNEINRLLEEVKNKTGKKYQKNNEDSIYGLKDEHEFLSEAFSNPLFKQLLESIKDEKETNLSLWQKFVNLIFNLFKKESKYKTEIYKISTLDKLNSIIHINNFKFYNKSDDSYSGKLESLSKFITQKSQERLNQIQEVFNNNPELTSIGTPEQYSQYLESLNKPNTNPILQGNQKEQVKKFAELQERLNNKEFLEGAKLAFESSDLKDYGTLENYIDYIARISLGIIRNPTSGEFNNSVVKDIVYHGASKDFQGFIKNKKIIPKGKTKGGIWFTDFANADWVYKEEEGKVIAALINLKNPIEYKTERYFDDEYGDYLNSKPLKEGQWKDVQQLIDNKQGDGLLLDIFDATTSGDIGEFTKQQVVFEPEQIHVLSSKQDIEGFKKFVDNKKDEIVNENNNQSLQEYKYSITPIETESNNQLPIEPIPYEDSNETEYDEELINRVTEAQNNINDILQSYQTINNLSYQNYHNSKIIPDNIQSLITQTLEKEYSEHSKYSKDFNFIPYATLLAEQYAKNDPKFYYIKNELLNYIIELYPNINADLNNKVISLIHNGNSFHFDTDFKNVFKAKQLHPDTINIKDYNLDRNNVNELIEKYFSTDEKEIDFDLELTNGLYQSNLEKRLNELNNSNITLEEVLIENNHENYIPLFQPTDLNKSIKELHTVYENGYMIIDHLINSVAKPMIKIVPLSIDDSTDEVKQLFESKGVKQHRFGILFNDNLIGEFSYYKEGDKINVLHSVINELPSYLKQVDKVSKAINIDFSQKENLDYLVENIDANIRTKDIDYKKPVIFKNSLDLNNEEVLKVLNVAFPTLIDKENKNIIILNQPNDQLRNTITNNPKINKLNFEDTIKNRWVIKFLTTSKEGNNILNNSKSIEEVNQKLNDYFDSFEDIILESNDYFLTDIPDKLIEENLNSTEAEIDSQFRMMWQEVKDDKEKYIQQRNEEQRENMLMNYNMFKNTSHYSIGLKLLLLESLLKRNITYDNVNDKVSDKPRDNKTIGVQPVLNELILAKLEESSSMSGNKIMHDYFYEDANYKGEKVDLNDYTNNVYKETGEGTWFKFEGESDVDKFHKMSSLSAGSKGAWCTGAYGTAKSYLLGMDGKAKSEMYIFYSKSENQPILQLHVVNNKAVEIGGLDTKQDFRNEKDFEIFNEFITNESNSFEAGELLNYLNYKKAIIKVDKVGFENLEYSDYLNIFNGKKYYKDNSNLLDNYKNNLPNSFYGQYYNVSEDLIRHKSQYYSDLEKIIIDENSKIIKDIRKGVLILGDINFSTCYSIKLEKPIEFNAIGDIKFPSLKSIHNSIKFNNKGNVFLHQLESIKTTIEFNNSGQVWLPNITSIDIPTKFNNRDFIYVPKLKVINSPVIFNNNILDIKQKIEINAPIYVKNEKNYLKLKELNENLVFLIEDENNEITEDTSNKGTFIDTSENKFLVFNKNSDLTTAVHEKAHEYEKVLTINEILTLESWSGYKKGTKEFSEAFAVGAEKYIYDGAISEDPKLNEIFRQFKIWFKGLIRNAVSYFKDINELNEEVKAIYQEMMSSENRGKNLRDKSDFKQYLKENQRTLVRDSIKQHAAKIGMKYVEMENRVYDMGELQFQNMNDFVKGFKMDEETKEVFKYLEENHLDRLNKIQIIETNQEVPAYYKDSKIYINTNLIKETSIANELLQLLTLDIINNPTNDAETEFVNNLKKLYDEFKREMKDREFNYITNINEFLTYTLTNNKMQQYLSKINESLVNNIIYFIKSFFNIQYDSILNDIFNSNKQVIRKNDNILFQKDPIKDLASRYNMNTSGFMPSYINPIAVKNEIRNKGLNIELKQAVNGSYYFSRYGKFYNPFKFAKQIEGGYTEIDVLKDFSNNLSERFNIEVKLITMTEAEKLIDNYNGESSFYNTENQTAYLVIDRADETSAIHEIFTHPFLILIEKHNTELYNNLLNEAKSNKEVVQYVIDNYGKAIDHEIIARYIDLETRGELNRKNTIIDYIKDFYNNLSSYLKSLFNLKEVTIEQLNPNITLKELTQLILNSKIKIDLKREVNNKVNNFEDLKEIDKFWNQFNDYEIQRFLNHKFPNNRLVYRTDNNGLNHFNYSTNPNLKFGNGIYLTSDLNYTKDNSKNKTVYPVLLNSNNILEFNNKIDYYNDVASYFNKNTVPTKEEQNRYIEEKHKEGYSIYIKNSGIIDEVVTTNDNIVILNTESIHNEMLKFNNDNNNFNPEDGIKIKHCK